MPSHKPKILVIVGPTSSGKSELAVKLARRFQGEIISCDSRQIYRGMDLGTGKVPGKWHSLRIGGRQKTVYTYKGIVHHLIDKVDPRKQYSVSLFKKQAQKKIREISKNGRLPILCGGTGHWIDAVVYDQQLPEVEPDKKLRGKLEDLPTEGLYQRLSELDPVRAKNIDRFNRRRLIRALEIVISTGKPVPSLNPSPLALSPYDVLWLGIEPPQDILLARIEKRLKQRLKAGMLKEVQKLHHSGLSWQRLERFGLEYRFGALHLRKIIDEKEMFRQMLLANKHYAKRQQTWWKRNKGIVWFNSTLGAANLVKKFLD